MLVLMESMQVKQRIQNMESLRSMRTQSSPILVYRDAGVSLSPHAQRTWQYVQSSHLVPGDIVSLCSRKPRQQFSSASE